MKIGELIPRLTIRPQRLAMQRAQVTFASPYMQRPARHSFASQHDPFHDDPVARFPLARARVLAVGGAGGGGGGAAGGAAGGGRQEEGAQVARASGADARINSRAKTRTNPPPSFPPLSVRALLVGAEGRGRGGRECRVLSVARACGPCGMLRPHVGVASALTLPRGKQG